MKMEAEQKRKNVMQILAAANSPKSDLIDLARRLEEVSPRKAESLRTIICRLEDWQRP